MTAGQRFRLTDENKFVYVKSGFVETKKNGPTRLDSSPDTKGQHANAFKQLKTVDLMKFMFAQGWKSDYSLAEQLQQYFNGNSTNLADDDHLLNRFCQIRPQIDNLKPILETKYANGYANDY